MEETTLERLERLDQVLKDPIFQPPLGTKLDIFDIHVHWFGEGWNTYAEGYKEAADVLIERVVENSAGGYTGRILIRPILAVLPHLSLDR